MRNLSVAAAAIVAVAFSSAAFSNPPDVRGEVLEGVGIGQAAAEKIFSEAEAAVYFPELGRLRWLGPRGETTLDDFNAALERDFPYFRWSAYGPYILKQPATAGARARLIKDLDAGPAATVFTDSFESGLSNWNLDDNTLELYAWGRTNCSARTGSVSADAIRGGVNTLTCSDPYAPNVVTTMTHNSCEGLAGASQAWLDAWIHVATESGHDTLGFYYDDAGGNGYGYAFSGTWSAWFHVVLNLKQWYRVGDVTTTSCPKLEVQFKSDAAGESGFGARIDDLTVGTSAPTFLACAITAAPASGPAPLTVNFSPTVSGGTSSTAYLWSFGDSAGTTATSRNASFTYTTPGDYVARLRVEETGIRAYANTTIRVTTATPCTVSCNATVPSSGSPGSAISFQASATVSGCSSAPTYAWSFGDGQTSAQQNAVHTYTSAGTYSWSLTVVVNGVACSKNGSITIGTTTDGKKRRAVNPSGDVLDSETIGPSGGTLSGGGFTLTVPAGAFGANANLRLISGAASTPLDKFRTSKVFVLKGLPDDRAKPLSLTLDITRSVSVTGNDAVAIAGEVFVSAAAALDSPPLLIDATRSGSKVTATIPAAPATGQGAASAASMPRASDQDAPQSYTIWSASGFYSFNSAQGHFHIRHPVSDVVLGGAEEVAKGLESAYTSIAALGFAWNLRTSWPVSVCIEPFDADANTRLAETVPSRLGINGYWLHVNANRLTTQADIPLMKDAAVHELFHLAQYLYDSRNRIAMATQPGPWLWADEATAVWFENYFNGSAIPPQVVKENHAFMTRRGLEFPPGDTGTVQDHGYGAAQLMRDLAKRKGNAAVGEFVRRKSNSQVLPVDAYNTQTGSSAGSTWRLFLDEYVKANLYSAFPTSADLWSASSGKRYSFTSSATDSGTTFNWTAPDLSARIYGVQFNDTTWPAGTSVTLKLTDPAKDAVSLVYTMKSGTITSLGYHYDGESFKVANAETFAANGTSLLIVVANGRAVRPYSGTTPVSLQVGTPPPGTPASINIAIPEIFNGISQGTGGIYEGGSVTWTGSSFQFLWTETSESWTGTVNVKTVSGQGTVSADGKTLTSLHVNYEWKATYVPGPGGGTRYSQTWRSTTLSNVPQCTGNTYYTHCATGAAARPMITSWTHRELASGFGAGQDYDRTFTIDESRLTDLAINIDVKR